MSEATLTLQCASDAEAQALLEALAPDNEGFAAVTRDGTALTIRAESTSIMGLLRSLDDVLGCLRATGMD